ncbi:response regulator transcription factor [Mucilaginibacter mali]|uniref:Response regulator transcription factor n=1 Tax=Mucilaginibacter mali TaxID=2740462 RepID=A0A7D4Q4R0_9SPHI|nr:response regulator transcription factor [Mucilaginibacter mali]QKJ31187.1 response regulator transcription factor [Mucilaginibacter mali]
MPYKIAIVDDNRLVIKQLLQELVGHITVVFIAANGAEYLQKMKELPCEQYPQAILMDIEMPGMDGIEAVRLSTALYPQVQYIMFTVSTDNDKLFEAIKAGAHGYLLKDETVDVILGAIAEVVDKQGAPMSPSIARKTLKLLSESKAQPANDTNLSDREIEILKYIVSGLNYKQIADKIFLSPFTVRNHITKIYSKLHITSKAQAVQIAVSNKWV